MTDLWSFLLQTLTAAGAAALVLAVKALFRDKLSPRWQFAAWGALLPALILPAGWGGRYALFNWPLFVETLKSLLTGEYSTLTRVSAPLPLPSLSLPTRWDGWVFLLYWAGCLLLLGRYLLSYLRLRSALRRGRPAGEARQAQLQRVAQTYGLPACRAVEVEGLSSAFLCGLVSPVLALPAGAEVDDKVLLHELLHLKYHDTAWGVLLCLVRCVHWCNPLLWYCANVAGNDLEALCDQRVLERLEGEDRRDYGRILLSMAAGKYARAPGTSNLSGGGENIRRRIQAIARFKRYPAGMALVSVCVILVLAVPVAAGNRPSALPRADTGQNALSLAYTMAAARTTPCTTPAGAFDVYAKAVLTGKVAYRAMCMPLEALPAFAAEQKETALFWDTQIPVALRTDLGYEIYGLRPDGTEAWAGLLVVELENCPPGETWDGLSSTRWMALQELRAERQGDRWVILPQGEFTFRQGDRRVSGNLALPAWQYEGESGDLKLQIFYQTASHVDSTVQKWVFSTFDTAPNPDGEFQTLVYRWMTVTNTGDGPQKNPYRFQRTKAVIRPWDLTGQRPSPSPLTEFYSSSNGERFGSLFTDYQDDWTSLTHLMIGGWSFDTEDPLPPPAYAVDLYLDEMPIDQLTFKLKEGGPQ